MELEDDGVVPPADMLKLALDDVAPMLKLAFEPPPITLLAPPPMLKLTPPPLPPLLLPLGGRASGPLSVRCRLLPPPPLCCCSDVKEEVTDVKEEVADAVVLLYCG